MQTIFAENISRGNLSFQKSFPQIIKLTKSKLILGRGIHSNKIRNIYANFKQQKIKTYIFF